MLRTCLICVAAFLLAAAPALAALTYSVSPVGSATVTSGSKITVTFSSETVDSHVTIFGSANDALSVEMYNTSTTKTLYMNFAHLNAPSQTLGSITAMDAPGGNGGGPIVIESLETTGDVENIGATRVMSADIGGEGVAGSPNVENFQYYFTLLSDCNYDGFAAVYDQNQDEVFNSADIYAWAGAPSDVNGDAVADTADLDKLLAALAR